MHNAADRRVNGRVCTHAAPTVRVTHMRVLGIDFGTSNTAAMLRMPDGRMRPLLFDGAPLMPTAVYLNTDGSFLVGRDAERHARVDPTRFEPNPKRRVDDVTMLLGDQELAVAKVFSAVLSQVAQEARRQLGGQPQELRLTHPARWGEQRRRLLVEASRMAQLPAPQLIVEPVAAASYFTAVLRTAVPVGRCLAIYDLGGGTFDATVVRRTAGGFQVLAEEGLPDVGGLDFDHAIVEHLGKVYGESHPDQWRALAAPADANERRLRRLLYDDVKAAKEMLSRTTSADIHLPSLEIDGHLTREEFESLVRPQLERTVVCLARCIKEAGITATDMAGIFLVGGSSRIPLAAHLIHTELGLPPTILEQPETVVVEGALCIGAPAPGPGAAAPSAHSGVPQVFTPRPPAPPRPQNWAPAQPAAMPRPAPQPPRMVPPAQPRPVSPPPLARPAPQPVAPQVPGPMPQMAPQPSPMARPVAPPPVAPAPAMVRPAPQPIPQQPMPVRPQPMVQQNQAASGNGGRSALLIVLILVAAVLLVVLLIAAVA
jgi:molecular chaperone DnaK